MAVGYRAAAAATVGYSDRHPQLWFSGFIAPREAISQLAFLERLLAHTERMMNPPLKEMAPHIAYEMERLRFVASHQAFMDGSHHGGALAECFLLHYRNLIDFLYAPRKSNTDAIAADYLDAGSTWMPNMPSWWKEDKDRCNKLLHHPTYDRVEYEKAGALMWKRDFRDQAAHLFSDWTVFLNSLPRNRQEWFNVPPQKF